MSSGGKKGGGDRPVFDYLMSMHWGICWGPVDALLGIWVKERDAWPGKTKYDDDSDQDGTITVDFNSFINAINGGTPGNTNTVAVQSGDLRIDRPDLFGGDEKEGGVVGTASYLDGNQSQTLPELLAGKLGLTTATAPGYRGIASLWFHQDNLGFMWSQNNPYMPTVWATVFRPPRGLNEAEALIQRDQYWPDANPIHIIYECLTNVDWGMGSPSTIIDVPSFEAASTVMVAEQFGLSMIWKEQATIEDFVKEVLDHIQGTLFLNPATGLLEITLIRDDYDANNLRQFNPDNCNVTKRQRKAWAETINEINITWTNPESEKEHTVTYQDLSNLAMQGEIVSDTRNYYGVRNKELAGELGARDIRSASYPLFSCELEADRRGWDLKPGDVCELTWPEDNIERVVMRVGKVNYGRPGGATVKASLVEDIFSLELGEWTQPVATQWVNPSVDPDPMDFVFPFTVPYPMLVRAGLDTETGDDNYPDVVVGIAANQLETDTVNFDLVGPQTSTTGEVERISFGAQRLTPTSVTTADIVAEVETQVTQTALGPILGAEAPVPGGFIIFQGPDETVSELGLLQAYDDQTDTWTIHRAIFDTIPRSWSTGTRVWYVPITFDSIDPATRVADVAVDYQLRTRTSRGLLPLGQTPNLLFAPSERPYLPLRPADLRLNGVQGLGVPQQLGTFPSTVAVSWANRNRTLEDAIPPRYDDANATPETGQTTTIRVKSVSGALLAEVTGLTGTSHTFDMSAVSTGNRFLLFETYAVRDGYESFQPSVEVIEVDLLGFGFNFGQDFGENDG